MNHARRVRAFLLVGAVGFAVQLAAFALLVRLAEWPLVAATATSVLAAVLHNFVWHALWTWADRPGRALVRLAQFTLATGSSSVAGNVIFVSLLVGVCHVDPFVATVLAVGATSAVNYLMCDRYVFG